MPDPITAEQILRTIAQRHPRELGDARRLSALFWDYSRGQLRPQANALDIFLKCEGNTRVLALRGVPGLKQRAEFHRLLQEMVRDYGMQEEIARKVSAAFWRAAIGTEPPVPAGEPAPVREPSRPAPKAADSTLTAEEMYERGNAYCNAPGMPPRQWWPMAVQWLERAAQLNHLEAQKKLGNMYSQRAFERDGIFPDPVKSAYWYRKAAEQGDAPSQVALSRCYRDGNGVPQDYDQAVYWCRKAADQNNFFAMGELRYLFGYRLNAPEKAAYWSRRAAELGYSEEQWRLGQMYEQGFGVVKDGSQAVYWYRKAAEQGDAASQVDLGRCYENGYGTARDDSQALYWYRKAAEADYRPAQRELSRCYREGIGTAKDPAQADYWQRKANGDSPKAAPLSGNVVSPRK